MSADLSGRDGTALPVEVPGVLVNAHGATELRENQSPPAHKEESTA
jgi:hypothetical protein